MTEPSAEAPLVTRMLVQLRAAGVAARSAGTMVIRNRVRSLMRSLLAKLRSGNQSTVISPDG
jgi:hypothetical protein